MCDILVCGVIAQDEITKRKGTPVMTLEERLILGMLKDTDIIVFYIITPQQSAHNSHSE